jgi:hypothetical protein
MKESSKKGLHLEGEAEFEFPTYAGKVTLSASDDLMTPFGGLVPFAAFLRNCGLLERLVNQCPIHRTSPNASAVRDVLVSFLLTALCEGSRFSHVERFREDPTMSQLFGIKNVVGDDTIRRFFNQFAEGQGRDWIESAITPIWQALPEQLILDWDSTVLTRYGHQQGAVVGYNPHKRGRPSHHPLLAVAAGTRLCVSYRMRPGNTVSASQWASSMEEVQQSLGAGRVWLNRGDMGFGNDCILNWHETGSPRPHYLFKLKWTTGLRRAMCKVKEEQWAGPSRHGILQVAEAQVQLHGWKQPRRVVFGRRLLGELPKEQAGTFWDQAKHEFEAYVTSLPQTQVNAWQMIDLYRKRADTENVFDEIKNQWGFAGFCSRSLRVTELAARLLLLTYNLWNLFLRLMRPDKHLEAITSRKWFLLIAARLVKSSRQRTLHVAVSGAWWQELKDGYQRVSNWIKRTAPQLKPEPNCYPDFSFLAPHPT